MTTGKMPLAAWACALICACAPAAMAAGGGDANQGALPPCAVARLDSTFLRHTAAVTAVSVSPDSKRVASAAADGSLCVWDVATGERVFHLKTDANPRDIALTPDGNALAYVSNAGLVTVLPLRDSSQPRTFSIARSAPFTRFSRNGAVVVFLWNGGAAVRRVADGNSLGEITYAGQPCGLAVSPRGDFFITMYFNARGGGFEIKRWDVPLRKARWTTTTRAGMVAMPQAISPDGWLVAAASNDGNIILMDANSGARLSSFAEAAGRMPILEFLPGGELAGCTQEGLSIWDANSGKCLVRGDAAAGVFFGQAVSALEGSPDGSFVATAGPWHRIGLWNARTGKALFDLHGHFGPIVSVAFAGGGEGIVSASSDGTVRRWGVADGNDTLVMALHDWQSQWVAVSTGGKWAASRSYTFQRPSVTLWDLDTGRPAWSLDPGQSAYSAAFSPGGQFLATGSYQYIRIWHVASGRLCRQVDLQPNPTGAATLAFSADDRLIAVGGASVRIFETATGLEAASLDVAGGRVRAMAFSPDGRLLLATSDKGALLYDLRTLSLAVNLSDWPAGYVLPKEQEKQVEEEVKKYSAVAFSADGRKVATGGDDGAILLWNAPRAAPAAATQPADGNELADLWEALALDDSAKAFAAAQRLIRQGPAAVTFLKARLAPLAPATQPADVNKLLADLDGDSYRVREEASRKLLEAGDAPRLQEALAKAKSDEVRTRLLDVLAGQANPVAADRQELRRGRALRVLEIIGDAAAREALSRLAEGGPGRLTRDARAALARLKAGAADAGPTTRP